MKKQIRTRTLQDIADEYAAISFPEYQRESTVWSLDAKQRLIDSILRSFDISTLYYYHHDDGVLDCIDGRQRLSAVMSFFGSNKDDRDDNGFAFKIKNEVYSDASHAFAALDGMTYAEILQASKSRDAHQKQLQSIAALFVRLLREYAVTEVVLSSTGRPEEFNLQFTRLNLGAILNSGEKLHAMVGALRDLCFGDNGLGQHPFLAATGIPTKRYAKEQTAAQIAAQVLSLATTKQLTRTRYLDLQVAFKDFAHLNSEAASAIEKLKHTLDTLDTAFGTKKTLRNRSITVSAVLRAYIAEMDKAEARRFAAFLTAFLGAVSTQISKGRKFDRHFEYLLDFQKHLTQASVERPAVEARDRILREGFEYWKEHGTIQAQH